MPDEFDLFFENEYQPRIDPGFWNLDTPVTNPELLSLMNPSTAVLPMTSFAPALPWYKDFAPNESPVLTRDDLMRKIVDPNYQPPSPPPTLSTLLGDDFSPFAAGGRYVRPLNGEMWQATADLVLATEPALGPYAQADLPMLRMPKPMKSLWRKTTRSLLKASRLAFRSLRTLQKWDMLPPLAGPGPFAIWVAKEAAVPLAFKGGEWLWERVQGEQQPTRTYEGFLEHPPPFLVPLGIDSPVPFVLSTAEETARPGPPMAGPIWRPPPVRVGGSNPQ